MMFKTIVALFALPMAAAKMRGVVDNSFEEELFPTRQLMGSMGGCPDPSDSPAILCTQNSECASSPFCAGREGCCCVSWTFGYCGVPSDCNQFLQCLPPDSPPAQPQPFSVEAVENSFTFLNRIATCLAEDELDMSGGAVELPAASEDMKSGAKKAKGAKKSSKMSKADKSSKRMKKSKSDKSKMMKMDSEDY